MSAHTPGPWVWNESQHYLSPANPDPERSAVHTILDVGYGGTGFIGSDPAATSRELAANYALIRAAPDLYDAVVKAEALLSRQRWIADGSSMDPEAIVLVALRAALEAAAPPADPTPTR